MWSFLFGMVFRPDCDNQNVYKANQIWQEKLDDRLRYLHTWTDRFYDYFSIISYVFECDKRFSCTSYPLAHPRAYANSYHNQAFPRIFWNSLNSLTDGWLHHTIDEILKSSYTYTQLKTHYFLNFNHSRLISKLYCLIFFYDLLIFGLFCQS